MWMVLGIGLGMGLGDLIGMGRGLVTGMELGVEPEMGLGPCPVDNGEWTILMVITGIGQRIGQKIRWVWG